MRASGVLCLAAAAVFAAAVLPFTEDLLPLLAFVLFPGFFDALAAPADDCCIPPCGVKDAWRKVVLLIRFQGRGGLKGKAV